MLAATNRPQDIDAALRRPGRFDVCIEIPLPDAAARHQIFAVHLRRKPVAADLDVAALVAQTAGWSGADIELWCQAAAFQALRRVGGGAG
ncbi:MAG: hypothetical protein KatS3mg131_1375 [Candidatus Tectimicrobiota bacterium]|nr:MAG: hypothetical protein KatS3mg131_1375 [Candidatus Tectomicrobia bacterium]